MLPQMQKSTIRPGRPIGTTTYEAELAQAFGAVVRALRTRKKISQEALANLAGVERSHMGKIERGEHIPSLVIIMRIAEALGCDATSLVAETEKSLKRVRVRRKKPG